MVLKTPTAVMNYTSKWSSTAAIEIYCFDNVRHTRKVVTFSFVSLIIIRKIIENLSQKAMATLWKIMKMMIVEQNAEKHAFIFFWVNSSLFFISEKSYVFLIMRRTIAEWALIHILQPQPSSNSYLRRRMGEKRANREEEKEAWPELNSRLRHMLDIQY